MREEPSVANLESRSLKGIDHVTPCRVMSKLVIEKKDIHRVPRNIGVGFAVISISIAISITIAIAIAIDICVCIPVRSWLVITGDE
jgi:hypothetical protein